MSQEKELSKHQQARKPLGHLLWQMVALKPEEEALEAGGGGSGTSGGSSYNKVLKEREWWHFWKL